VREIVEGGRGETDLIKEDMIVDLPTPSSPTKQTLTSLI